MDGCPRHDGLVWFGPSGRLRPDHRYVTETWGKGVATEAAARVLDYGFREFQFDPIVAVTHPANAASHNVLKKIGLQAGGMQFHYGLDLSYFSLSRRDRLTDQ